MSFKATFDIAVNYSHFKIKDFHKTGSLHYRTCIYYIDRSDPKKQKVLPSLNNKEVHNPVQYLLVESNLL